MVSMKKQYLAVYTSICVRFKGIFTIVLETVSQYFTSRYDNALMTREHGNTTVCIYATFNTKEIYAFVFNFAKLLAIKLGRKFGNICRLVSRGEK